MAKYSEHSFYCIKCGEKGITLPRRDSHQYSKYHRKKLWCWRCKCEVNHVECKNDEEVYEFKQAFAAGEFENELKESLDYISKEYDIVWG